MFLYPGMPIQFIKSFRSPPPALPGYSGLYLSSAFRNLGMSMISLFIPIYVWQKTGGISYVFLFYALYHLLNALSNYPVAVLVKHLGVDLVGLFGSLIRAFSIFLLLKAKSDLSLLWLSSAFLGMAISFTWIPFRYAFTIAKEEAGKYVKEVSRLQIVNQATGLIGPLAGGLIIAIFGFDSLYAFAIVLIVISGVPIFFDTIKRKKMRLSWEKITDHLSRKKRRGLWFSIAGSQLQNTILGLVWPLFIYLMVGDFEVLGLIKTGSAFLSLVLVWFLGRWMDKRGKSVFHLGVVVNAFNILLRPFLASPFALFLVDSAYGITNSLVVVPFNLSFYETAHQMRRLEFMVEREIVSHVAGFLICLFLIGAFVLEVPWFWIFFLGVVGLSLRSYILSKEERKRGILRRLLGRFGAG